MSPPTCRVRVPARAPETPPLIGASRTETSLASRVSWDSRRSRGRLVVRSTRTAPAPRSNPLRRPSLPRTTSSNASGPGRQVRTRSLPAASSRGLDAQRRAGREKLGGGLRTKVVYGERERPVEQVPRDVPAHPSETEESDSHHRHPSDSRSFPGEVLRAKAFSVSLACAHRRRSRWKRALEARRAPHRGEPEGERARRRSSPRSPRPGARARRLSRERSPGRSSRPPGGVVSRRRSLSSRRPRRGNGRG